VNAGDDTDERSQDSMSVCLFVVLLLTVDLAVVLSITVPKQSDKMAKIVAPTCAKKLQPIKGFSANLAVQNSYIPQGLSRPGHVPKHTVSFR
jgi:hypothetical protein